ncbi:MAG: DinB family protein [Gemmatimonadetes bacterium]|nr:DinB family protein [Gemmatimonadota bacterium]
MVYSKPELIAGMQNEVRILLHLASKIDPAQQDYRPTPKQRSTLELLRYLTMMGPALVGAAKAGVFDEAAWGAAEQKAAGQSLAEVVASIAALSDWYGKELSSLSDADFRAEVSLFGAPMSRGAWLVTWVLAGHAAYRTQLFLYLKASGREELGTMNLWAGMDAPAA